MYREAKGTTVNTILELEFHALLSYDDKIPPVYTVGPILNPENPTTNNDILQWLEGQPKSSVVFLCFGTRGCFSDEQVNEMANPIEKSGYRFIWSLSRPTKDLKTFPENTHSQDNNEVLPEGFLEHTSGNKKMLGWVPKTEVQSHEAVKWFISQYPTNQSLLSAQDTEKGIRGVMDRKSEVRARVTDMKAKSRMALEQGGSSYISLKHLANAYM
ncbi:hypothetical protein Tco_0564710 [Tanacetum coccineum]